MLSVPEITGPPYFVRWPECRWPTPKRPPGLRYESFCAPAGSEILLRSTMRLNRSDARGVAEIPPVFFRSSSPSGDNILAWKQLSSKSCCTQKPFGTGPRTEVKIRDATNHQLEAGPVFRVQRKALYQPRRRGEALFPSRGQRLVIRCGDSQSIRVTEKHYSPWVQTRQDASTRLSKRPFGHENIGTI
jgi:hypothetical protein